MRRQVAVQIPIFLRRLISCPYTKNPDYALVSCYNKANGFQKSHIPASRLLPREEKQDVLRAMEALKE
jgi:hypothetical protein